MKNQLNIKQRLAGLTVGMAVLGGTAMMAAPSLAAGPTVTLTATNLFEPGNVTVEQGDTVTFTWAGGFHDVTFSDGTSSGTPVGIDGTTYSRTFDSAGTFDYVCTIHESSGMVGSVTVNAGAGATATTAAPAAETTATTAAAAAPADGSTSASSAAVAQPFAGPEKSLLPAAGLALVLAGFAMRLRLRRAS